MIEYVAERTRRDAQTIMPRLHQTRLRAGALNTPRAEGSKHIMRPSERACALGKPWPPRVSSGNPMRSRRSRRIEP